MRGIVPSIPARLGDGEALEFLFDRGALDQQACTDKVSLAIVAVEDASGRRHLAPYPWLIVPGEWADREIVPLDWQSDNDDS